MATSFLGRLLSGPVNWALARPRLRRKLAFELKRRHFAELEFQLPLSAGLKCPVVFPEAVYSFGEIFCEGEYARAFGLIPPPRRWLDLGCHAGYFSLYTVLQRATRGLDPDVQALLIDADPRVAHAVERLIHLNGLHGRMRFRPGMITTRSGPQDFVCRDVMSSSSPNLGTGNGQLTTVPAISADDIRATLPPPYDLIKTDIEGSEFEFLGAYASLLQDTQALLLEWHSWHAGGGGGPQLVEMVRQLGFSAPTEIVPAHRVAHDGKDPHCGVLLFTR